MSARAQPDTVDVVDAVKAVYRINGVVLPGTIFIPTTDEDREELFAAGAIEALSEAEEIVASKMPIPTLAELTASRAAVGDAS